MTDENTSNNHFKELCASYVLGTLNEEEHREFEQMLETASEEERQLYQKMKSVANQLSFTIEQHEPDPDIKERLMKQIQTESSGEEQSLDISQQEDTQKIAADEAEGHFDIDDEGFNWTAFGVATSFALLIITLSLMFYVFNLRSDINERDTLIEEHEHQITELENELQHHGNMLAILESRDVNLVEMSGMEANPNGYGKVIWNENNQQALLQISNLPASPPDSVYQLWVLTGDEPIGADVFSVNNEDEQFLLIEKFRENSRQSANGFAVSEEPEGGSQQLSGEMYLMGNME